MIIIYIYICVYERPNVDVVLIVIGARYVSCLPLLL